MNTRILNKYIQDVLQLPGVTAKVFRTAKASSTFQDQLKKFTNLDGDVLTKLKSFHQASLFVAKLCNHFRALPKSSSMAKMETGMDPKVEDKTIEYEQISIKTYKMNYIDPRISVAWSKKNDVPIELIFTKTQRENFDWAIEQADEDFEFWTIPGLGNHYL